MFFFSEGSVIYCPLLEPALFRGLWRPPSLLGCQVLFPSCVLTYYPGGWKAYQWPMPAPRRTYPENSLRCLASNCLPHFNHQCSHAFKELLFFLFVLHMSLIISSCSVLVRVSLHIHSTIFIEPAFPSFFFFFFGRGGSGCRA